MSRFDMLGLLTVKLAETAPAPQPVTPQVAAPEHKTGIPTLKAWFAPYPHQAASVEKLYNNKGRLILAHEAGSGKTATAIYGMEKLRFDKKAKKALVITPSGLRNNFGISGIGKFTHSDYQIVGNAGEKRSNPKVVTPDKVSGDKPYTIVSYSQFRRRPEYYIRQSGADTLILDEFHATRNERTQTFKAINRIRPLVTNVMGLTASPINNDPAELATLLTITEGRRIISPAQFRHLFVKTVGFTEGFNKGKKKKVQDLKNRKQLLRLALPRVDYVSTKDLKGKTMPRRDVKSVNVPMSGEQYDMYQLALDKLGPLKKYMMRRDTDLNMREAKMVFTQLMQARQVSNSIHTSRRNMTAAEGATRTPKMRKIIEDTIAHLAEDPTHKVVVYSNLVKGGIDALDAGLRAKGLDPAIFIGKGTELGGRKITGPVRQQGVRDYKSGKKRVIVISGAGAQGLDLKNSTAFFAADGHFNPEVIMQSEARARRLGGQEFRKPENRRVDIRRYKSVVPDSAKPGFFGKMMGKKSPQTTDEWVYNVADRKARKTRSFKRTMSSPHKYIKKYRAASGKTVYVYPKNHQPKTPTNKPPSSSWKFWE